jgi:hypothetical protein
MGQYTELHIQIECQKKSVAEAICEVIGDFKNKVKTHILKNGESFDSNITDINDYDGQVEIVLNSSRNENAEWQMNAIIKILQEEKILPSNFNVDKNLQGFMSLDMESFNEYKPNL